MENRNRNTAILLIAAGLFLLFGNWVGFWTVSALVIMWLAIYKLRSGDDKTGYILLAIGVVILLGNHLSLVIAMILISLGYYYIKSRQVHLDDHYFQKQSILESIKWNKDPWVLKKMSVWSIIGEVDMDLSLAVIEKGETTIVLQGIIGDINLIVPDEIGVRVSASVMFGQVDVFKERESGLMNKIEWQSANYEMNEHRVRIVISYLIGDIDIKTI